ncbi:hypothetical protein TPHA_0F01470 [Tetrapisispora phaffii CBS 4417]|uniref:Uncharacterized protein n=1 Tax=Tetrapisispora phaffii (strain ATCC 24235 / CBS 4417 / NBRC 1672 / NRRL Y-8282 / UCD 70-5) TaxID=1071381 RepID=G8BV49_TETPH|nr:hypothetical protein TPHA_0F01470 [Tetrapisispora phaffii CBS 4417]CCE63631.1 hypothetical protein TPHA_0F01470 [Tetrapisispora phaffii CBS 4417]
MDTFYNNDRIEIRSRADFDIPELPLNENIVYDYSSDRVVRTSSNVDYRDGSGHNIGKSITTSFQLLNEEYQDYQRTLGNSNIQILRDYENHVLIKTDAQPTGTSNNSSNANENGDYLNQFSNWERYANQRRVDIPVNIQPFNSAIGRHSSTTDDKGFNLKFMKRHVSLRRKDFTNDKEYNNFEKRHKKIFHRGFFGRNNSIKNQHKPVTTNDGKPRSSHRRNRSKFRNKFELYSVLKFINLQTLPLDERDCDENDTTSYSNIKYFLNQKQLFKLNPKLMVDLKSIANSSNANFYMNRKRSVIKRKNIIPRPTTATATVTNNNRTIKSINNIKRGNSICTTTLNKYSKNSQEYQACSLWKEYLTNIMYQRIELRLKLLNMESS